MIPKIELPTYEVTLPSNKTEVPIRPFTVKEEKMLLMAIESGEEQDIINTTKQIIRNCVVSENVDIDKLPFFDIDYLFIALRAKSIGDTVEVRFKCNHEVDGAPCGNVFPAKIDIAKPAVKNLDRDSKIRVSNAVTVNMKYPTYAVMKMINDNDLAINKKIVMIANSIDWIQNKEQVLTPKDLTKEELYEFVEGLTQEKFKLLEEWVDNYPFFVVETEAKCGKCGFTHRLEYSDFASFFV